MINAPSRLQDVPVASASDVELLAAISDGNTQAFWMLWLRYKENVGEVCLSEMGGNAADAQDAMSEVMIKALACLPSQAKKINWIDAWLCRMARNLCIDLKRERGRWCTTMEKFGSTAVTHAPAVQTDAGDEIGVELQVRIDSLPPFLKEPFVLHALQETSSEKVALQLGLSPETVRKRAQLARSRLRCEIESGLAIPSETGFEGVAGMGEFSHVRTQESFERGMQETANEAMGTACVRLPCGAEQLFHVFSGERMHRPERRINSLRGYLLKHPFSWRSRAQLAEQYYFVGCWNEAIAEWKKIVDRHAWLPVGLRLGGVLLKLGERDAAATVYEKVKYRHFGPPAIMRHLNGWGAFVRNDAEQAVAEFTAAMELEAGNPAHLHSLSLACRLAGDRSGALKALERALALDANDRVALSDGHELLLCEGNVDEAARRARRLLQLHPSDVLTTWRLVDCLGRMGAVEGDAGRRTKVLVRRVSKHHENVFYTRETLGTYFCAKDEEQKAVAICRKFLGNFPQCPRARKIFSRFSARLEDGNRKDLICATAVRRVGGCNGACFWNGAVELART